MSWDVMIYTKDPLQPSGDTNPPPLGDAGEVRAKISKSLPKVDWSDPTWGWLKGSGWSIEFNHQKDGVTDSIMLHVRGSGDPVSSIVKLCKDNGWVAVDTSTGTLLDLDAPSSKSWHEFQAFRDSVTASIEQPTPDPSLLGGHLVTSVSVALLVVIVVGYLLWRR